MEDVIVVTMSEFGRTAKKTETEAQTTPRQLHARNGKPNRRRKGLRRLAGLEREQLYEGRDLNLTTDFRDVLSQLVTKHLGTKNVEKVFPGYKNNPRSLAFISG